MQTPSEGCPTIDVSDQKEWAILAIKNGFAALTNEQLEDFIHTVKSATCAYFRIVDNKESEKSYRIFFMSLNGGFQPFATVLTGINPLKMILICFFIFQLRE